MVLKRPIREYSDILRNEVIIVGPYPPPRGGISIHIERFICSLDAASVSYHVFNHGFFQNDKITATNKKYSWWIKFFFVCYYLRHTIRSSHTVFHFHAFTYFHFLYIYWFAKVVSRRVVVTIHNEDFFHYSVLKRIILVAIVRNLSASKIISVSQRMDEFICGIRKGFGAFIPAYVAPQGITRKEIEIKRGFKEFWVVTSLWRLSREQMKRYGLDLTIKLIQEFPNMTLFLFIGDRQNSDENVLRNLLPDQVISRIKIYYEEELFGYLWNFQVFVRTNREDGFGVSIVEAMANGVAAVASDACVRPKGSILFRSGDYEDFKANVVSVLEGKKRSTTPPANTYAYDQQIIDLYREIHSSN